MADVVRDAPTILRKKIEDLPGMRGGKRPTIYHPHRTGLMSGFGV
jgi:hypothetical protein